MREFFDARRLQYGEKGEKEVGEKEGGRRRTIRRNDVKITRGNERFGRRGVTSYGGWLRSGEKINTRKTNCSFIYLFIYLFIRSLS